MQVDAVLSKDVDTLHKGGHYHSSAGKRERERERERERVCVCTRERNRRSVCEEHARETNAL